MKESLRAILITSALLLVSGCASPETVPVAISCSPIPEPPEAIAKSVTTQKNLTDEYERLIQEFKDYLQTGQKPK